MGVLDRLFPVREGCCAVILAAGLSQRMGSDKMTLELGGKPVLAHSLLAFERCPDIDEIVVVAREDMIVETAELCREFGIEKAVAVMAGGSSRAESALIGLTAVRSGIAFAAIHDGARPLVTPELISGTVAAATEGLAAVPAVPLRDTVKFVLDSQVRETPDRASLMAVQTPQVFDTDIVKAALTDALDKNLTVTDDCSAVEALGISVRVVEGDDANIKLTTPLDLVLAEAILASRGGTTR